MGDGSHVEVVAEYHVREFGPEPDSFQEPGVDARTTDQVSPTPLEQVGQLIGDDDPAARTGDASHFFQCAFRVAKEVKTANAQDRVERTVGERDAFALGQGEQQVAAGVTIPAGR